MDKRDSTYTLRIEEIQETDGAIYQCQVIISLTDKEIADVPLIVRRPPVISGIYLPTANNVNQITNYIQIILCSYKDFDIRYLSAIKWNEYTVVKKFFVLVSRTL